MPPDPTTLFTALRSGDRGALARAITLVESRKEQDVSAAQELLALCLPHAGDAHRIGITGIPGVGKSTLIDALGMELIERGAHVAVLAIDPSSDRSGGSILGDKTRMNRLSGSPRAYIRPTPTGGTLGGVARTTQGTIVLCEAAGFDHILVETVGVGQNELAVDRMTDISLLLVVGGTGDELQGIKRGIMEAADVIAVTKADGDALARSRAAVQDLKAALSLLPPRTSGRMADVLSCSAVSGTGIAELLDLLLHHLKADAASGHRAQRRREQQVFWLEHAIAEALQHLFTSDPVVQKARADVQRDVENGALSPFAGAAILVERFRKGGAPPPSA